MTDYLKTLSATGLQNFRLLSADAVNAVTERFYLEHGEAYVRFGQAGRDACREDIAFHLEFLRPVLEFGLIQPMVDYLQWLASVLEARAVPVEHLTLSLDWLAEFFVAKMDAGEGEIVAAALHAARSKVKVSRLVSLPPVAPISWDESATFEAALLKGDQHEALGVINQVMDKGRGLVEVEMHIIQPALYRIGEKWQANQVSVAQEHMASAIAQSVMTVGLVRSPTPTPLGQKILLACVEGNNHAIGLRMVADAFQLAGWDVQYLGANVPSQSLLQQIIDWQPDLVGLSVSFPQQLRVVKGVITLMNDRLGFSRPAVIVGGLAINRFSQLTQQVGADAAGGDAEAAVVLANQMVIGHHSL